MEHRLLISDWDLDLIDVESAAFARGCDDAHGKLGWHGQDYADHEDFADYAAGFDLVMELKLREFLEDDDDESL